MLIWHLSVIRFLPEGVFFLYVALWMGNKTNMLICSAVAHMLITMDDDISEQLLRIMPQ